MKSAIMEGLARNQKGFYMVGQEFQPTPFQLEQPVLPCFVTVKWASQFQNLLHLNLDTLMHHNHKCSMEWGNLNLEVPHQSHQCEFLNGLESNQKATVYRRSNYMLFLKPCSFRSQAGYLSLTNTSDPCQHTVDTKSPLGLLSKWLKELCPPPRPEETSVATLSHQPRCWTDEGPPLHPAHEDKNEEAIAESDQGLGSRVLFLWYNIPYHPILLLCSSSQTRKYASASSWWLEYPTRAKVDLTSCSHLC